MTKKKTKKTKQTNRQKNKTRWGRLYDFVGPILQFYDIINKYERASGLLFLSGVDIRSVKNMKKMMLALTIEKVAYGEKNDDNDLVIS